MNININDKEVTLKYSFRGFIIYENITNETFSPKGLKEIITLFYSILMASDKELTIAYEDFIDMLDEKPNLLSEFSEWLNENINKSKSLSLDIKEGSEETTGKK